MPKFVYVGDAGRYYALPAPANSPAVGETYTLDAAPPDDRWEPVKKSTNDPAPAGDTKE